MDNVQLSQANQVYISNQAQNKNATSPIQPQAQQVEDGENKINKVLLGLGILGGAAIGITCVIRGRKPKNTPDSEDIQKVVKQFKDIDFNKGQAKLKDGTLFTGAIEKVSKNGDKLSMEYIEGVLQKSTKTTNGVETVKEYTNGVISKKNGEVVDIKKVQDEVKAQQAKLKKLLANGEITSEEFQKQADEIKFKSKNNKTEIKKVYNAKVETEKAAKAEADKIAQETKEKAQKEEAERTAREQAEISKFIPRTNLEDMSVEELQKYQQSLIEQNRKIARSYSGYTRECDYSTEDLKLISQIREEEGKVSRILDKKIITEKYNAVIGKVGKTSKTFVKNPQSGENIEIILDRIPPQNSGTYTIIAKTNNEVLGRAEISIPDGTIVSGLPSGYTEKALEVKFLGSSAKAKGTGTEIIKQVVRDSQHLGYEGRVRLDACGGSLPDSYKSLTEGKYGTSPVPFYYKTGFRFNSTELNKATQIGIENAGNGSKYTGPSGGAMYLPPEAIKTILAK